MVVVTSFAPPTEGIRHQQASTTACINKREIGKGTLYITESRLSWVNGSTGQGFSLEYPHIALHAVSRDLTAHPHECLYLMIDTNIEEPEPCDQENELEGSDLGLTEIRFVPDDKGMLDAMFSALSACQALHPDPQESFSEDEDEAFEDAEDDDGEYYIPGSGDSPLIVNVDRTAAEPNGIHATSENCEPMDTEEGQFEDAEIEHEN